jgi:hypothetical protein
LVATAGWLAAAVAADLPELRVPQGVGVNIHFTRGHEKDLDVIMAAGIKILAKESWLHGRPQTLIAAQSRFWGEVPRRFGL